MKVVASFVVLLVTLVLIEEGFGARSPGDGRNEPKACRRNGTTAAPLIRPMEELEKVMTPMDMANRNPTGNRPPPPSPGPTPPQ